MMSPNPHFRHLWAVLVLSIVTIRCHVLLALGLWFTTRLIKADKARDHAIMVELDTRRHCKEVTS